ncbi:MAG: VWA domain-containing protein [Ruminococcaceae bacterium]|nr:VWA domain-containing protein [Oscillospiraceae bacterium]
MIKMLDKFDKLTDTKTLLSILLALLLLFSAVPNVSVDAANGKIEDNGLPIVVSMGDSYSAGEGIEPFIDQELSNEEKVKSEDWLAHRSKNSWPGMLKIPGLSGLTRDHKDKNWFFVAASGAVTNDILDSQEKEYSRGIVSQYSGKADLPPQLNVFDKFEYGTVDYVTLTIGGNDVGFADIIKEAAVGSTYLGTSELADKLSLVWTEFFAKGGIREDIYQTYKAIEKAAGPQAQIIVAGYPQLLDAEGQGTLFSLEEATKINTNVTLFNMAIESIVEQCRSEGMKISFVSVENAFSGHEAYSDRAYINKVILGSEDEDLKNFQATSSYSIHPNLEGAMTYAGCVNEKLEELANEELINTEPKERDVVLVLDASGSMSGTPMSETKKASLKFVDTVLNYDANVGVVSYDSSATINSVQSDNKVYLDKAIGQLSAGGSTNIEDGLKKADSLLSSSQAEKKIIVLMSDGEPNSGKTGQNLIDYANELKDKGYYIYTLGFFSSISNKTGPQSLMDDIASEGCHYEVTDADSLEFFFGDIAAQIGDERIIYVRIACPVDVTVTSGGETMTSKDNFSSVRSSFGSMTFEQNKEEGANGSDTDADNDNRIKILRLKEGVDYDIKIEGNGKGKMNYSIGFMNDDGEYSDMREFNNIKITPKTEIDTVAAVSDATYMYVDEDGDGKYDLTYKAKADSKAELVDYTYIIYICLGVLAALAVLIIFLCLRKHFKIKKYL